MAVTAFEPDAGVEGATPQARILVVDDDDRIRTVVRSVRGGRAGTTIDRPVIVLSGRSGERDRGGR